MLAVAKQSDLLQRHGTPPMTRRALERPKYFLLFVLLVAATGATAQQPSAQLAHMPPVMESQIWIASWGTSQQIPEPQNALPTDDLRDATVREIVPSLRRRSAAAGSPLECLRDGRAAHHFGPHRAPVIAKRACD